MNSNEQALHDDVNLVRLVKRLEQSISDPSWNETRGYTWIKTQSTLQKVKYAKRLLKNAEAYDTDPTPKNAQRYHDIRTTLGRVEIFIRAVEKRTAPKPFRPDPILPHIPPPQMESPMSPPPNPSSPEDSLFPADEKSPLLLDTSHHPSSDTPVLPSSSFASPVPTLIPPILPPSSSKSTATAVATGITPRFLQNSNVLQQELSDQLAQMAVQLKRNAIHFSESLAKDQVVVEETQQKIEGNFDVMKTERVRLRDHRGKSGSTTCLVMLSIITVSAVFVLMMYLIRLT